MGMIVKLIRSLNETLGLTSIIVSHDIHETLGIADHVAIIANKQVVAQGAPQDLLKHESPLVRQFLNGEPDGPVPFHYQANDYLDDLMARTG